MSGPLHGIRVLNFGLGGVGPWATTYLGLLGADVIKIEAPGGDFLRWGSPPKKGMGTFFIANNYTQRGIVLDLKNEDSREIGFRLVASADVALDNFRSKDVMVRLGLGYDVMSRINPRIVYIQSSGYGSRGPMDGMTNGEWWAQASGGETSLTGKPGGHAEVLRGIANMDWNAAMVNTLGILFGLYAREKLGHGLCIETSQFQSSVTSNITRFAEYFAAGVAPRPMGSARPNIFPDQAFPTAMGYIAISVVNDRIWARLCEAMGLRELVEDLRFASNQKRVENRDILVPILEAQFKKKAAVQWLRIFREHGVPCGEYFEGKPQTHILREHPQINANRMIETIDTPWGPVNVGTGQWRFSKNTTSISRPAPMLDQHRGEILKELGFREAANH